MFSTVFSAAVFGIDVRKVTVEVDARRGLPTEYIVGLPDKSVRESKNRIKSAILHAGFQYPPKCFTINLAPADFPKVGSLFDLPIAVGLLKATGQIELPDDLLFVGELGLDGSVKSIRGSICIADFFTTSNFSSFVLPSDNYSECSLISNAKLCPISTLSDIKNLFMTSVCKKEAVDGLAFVRPDSDFSEVKGHAVAKRALEVAVVGRHNILFAGSPGWGKSMLMKRIPSILPPLSKSEALECFKISSVSTSVSGVSNFSLCRPFCSPHHSISHAIFKW